MFCQECGAELQKDAKFCPICGKNTSSVPQPVLNSALHEKIEKEKNKYSQIQKLSTIQIFHFENTSGLIPKHTDITSDGISLTVKQYNKVLVSFNEKSDSFDIIDIDNITQEKRRPVSSIVTSILILLCLILFAYGGQLVGAIICLVGFISMIQPDKYMVIFHKHGVARVRASFGAKSDMEKFLSFIRARNPDCVKIIL